MEWNTRSAMSGQWVANFCFVFVLLFAQTPIMPASTDIGFCVRRTTHCEQWTPTSTEKIDCRVLLVCNLSPFDRFANAAHSRSTICSVRFVQFSLIACETQATTWNLIFRFNCNWCPSSSSAPFRFLRLLAQTSMPLNLYVDCWSLLCTCNNFVNYVCLSDSRVVKRSRWKINTICENEWNELRKVKQVTFIHFVCETDWRRSWERERRRKRRKNVFYCFADKIKL